MASNDAGGDEDISPTLGARWGWGVLSGGSLGSAPLAPAWRGSSAVFPESRGCSRPYRVMLASKRYNALAFARELGGAIAAPPAAWLGKGRLKVALSLRVARGPLLGPAFVP